MTPSFKVVAILAGLVSNTAAAQDIALPHWPRPRPPFSHEGSPFNQRAPPPGHGPLPPGALQPTIPESLMGRGCNATVLSYCNGTDFNVTLQDQYVCGDSRLGPVMLPTKLPLSSEFETYNRFGGLCPGAFLDAWFNNTLQQWNYPDAAGFSLDSLGQAIEGNVTLGANTIIDRFGSEFGSLVSPAEAPYMQRSLPPSNLDASSTDPGFPYSYHAYSVQRPVTVLAGPTAPWFGQPGQGVRYVLPDTVSKLVEDGTLLEINPYDTLH